MTYTNMSYHWWISERASFPSIAQYVKGNWFLINEAGPVTEQEMNRRGWQYHCSIIPYVAPGPVMEDAPIIHTDCGKIVMPIPLDTSAIRLDTDAALEFAFSIIKLCYREGN